MPNSSAEGKDWAFNIVRTLGPINKVLDIGCGSGGYYKLLKPTNEKAFWIGVEIFKPYINQFKLKDMYDIVINQNAFHTPAMQGIDLVILGDVLEHMERREAIKVYTRFAKSSKYVLVALPLGVHKQGIVNANINEKHISTWYHKDVIEYFKGVREYYKGPNKGVYLCQW